MACNPQYDLPPYEQQGSIEHEGQGLLVCDMSVEPDCFLCTDLILAVVTLNALPCMCLAQPLVNVYRCNWTTQDCYLQQH